MTYEIRQPGCTAWFVEDTFATAKYSLIEAHQSGLNARLFIVEPSGERVPACEECGGPEADCAGPYGCTK